MVFADGKNKAMISNYGKVIKQLENEIFSFTDEFEHEKFIFDGNFMRFRFKTDDNLAYNKRINIPVCIVQFSNYKNIFIKMTVFKKYELFFAYKYKRWITLLIIKKTEMSY